MTRRAERNFNTLSWSVVVFVGLVVITLVLALQLFPRLSSGQRVLDGARPAFTDERVAGDVAGVKMVSNIVDLADPLVRDPRTAPEVTGLIAYVSQQTGLPQAAVVSALQSKFPHSLALLQAIPLQSVSAELPQLIAFVASHSTLTPVALLAALNQNFPHLAQAINALPRMTSGWNNVPGTAGVTRFDGSPVTTVPQVRDYLAGDVVGAVQSQRANFQTLDRTSPGLVVIPAVLLAIGIIATLYGLVMLLALRRVGVLDTGSRERRLTLGAWAVVGVVGIIVLALVPIWSLVGRLDAGQSVLDNLRPAFTDARVAGDAAGVSMVSTIVDVADPIVLESGGAASEVPKLVSFVATATGLSAAQVLSAIQQNFPHVYGLLNAIPLESVTAEQSGLTTFLTTTLKITPDQLNAALQKNFPQIAQSLAVLPAVTAGWANVPGTQNLTRFDGTPVRSVTQVRNYFALDVVPALQTTRADFQRLDGLPPPVTWVPPLLLIAGGLVLYYSLVMMYIWRPRPRGSPAVDRSANRAPAA
ncbi:MAG: hypothetical protein JF887_06940 [Candidatus Dormibacteraeota bacterium]|uniref:Uncharacterized protein n=1 Tax=Candidatus Amunia macphersoniae TaxID=3127014 RepID=A0A934KLR4_9BACT|nr:hypothetical protein [Candidatus Dormibacteraeota bacterium]